jgi:hypothetical protein
MAQRPASQRPVRRPIAPRPRAWLGRPTSTVAVDGRAAQAQGHVAHTRAVRPRRESRTGRAHSCLSGKRSQQRRRTALAGHRVHRGRRPGGGSVAAPGRVARQHVVLQQLRLRPVGTGRRAGHGAGREHGHPAAHRSTSRPAPHAPSQNGERPQRALYPRVRGVRPTKAPSTKEDATPCARRARARPGAWSPRCRICAAGRGP